MFARLAFVPLAVLGLSLPCQASVIKQPPARSTTAAVSEAPAPEIADLFVLPEFSMTFAEPAPRLTAIDRVLTLPNIALLATGLTWIALARRRLADTSAPARR